MSEKKVDMGLNLFLYIFMFSYKNVNYTTAGF